MHKEEMLFEHIATKCTFKAYMSIAFISKTIVISISDNADKVPSIEHIPYTTHSFSYAYNKFKAHIGAAMLGGWKPVELRIDDKVLFKYKEA